MVWDTKKRQHLMQSILHLEANQFDVLALDLFQYQAQHNTVYRQYITHLGIEPKQVQTVEAIPFLPIDCFKTHTIRTTPIPSNFVFRSSGTTGVTPSQHFIHDLTFYQQIAQRGFEQQYGSLNDFCILALLPSYLERQDSSLVYMIQHFMSVSSHPNNGFFLDNFTTLKEKLLHCITQQQPCLLIGVSFALMDFAEQHPMDLSAVHIMETGGMKGRRKELTRHELHTFLSKRLVQGNIHSEYGMTELLSQAYAPQRGIFNPIPSMKVLTREINDPLQIQKKAKTGAINVIDLANIDSCAFIATEDIGRVYPNGTFEILGRLDHAALRGCNLMVLDV